MNSEAVEDWRKAIGGELAREGNVVTPLIGGAETFVAMHRALATATRAGHYIYLLGWWLDLDVSLTGEMDEQSNPTAIGDHLSGRSAPPAKNSLRKIIEKAVASGVQVRVILWDQALSRKNSEEIRWLNELGARTWGDPARSGRLGQFDCAAMLDQLTLPVSAVDDEATIQTELPEISQGDISFEYQRIFLGSHHQKVLLVRGGEGLIGFCGGVDINPDRIGNPRNEPGRPMHDVHCRIVGPAVNDLVKLFVTRWTAHPDHVEIDRIRYLRGLTDRRASGQPPKGRQIVRVAANLHKVSVDGATYCRIEQTVKDTIIAAVKRSRRFIYIEDQYLGNLDLARAIKSQLPKLQHVLIVVPHPAVEPLFAPRRHEFLKIIGYEGKRGGPVRVFNRLTKGEDRLGPFSYIHSKLWIFDDFVALIGSANCNNRGTGFDSEVVAAIMDTEPYLKDMSFAQRLRARLWSHHLGVPEEKVLHGWDKSVMELWDEVPTLKGMVGRYPDHWDPSPNRSHPWNQLNPREERYWRWIDPNPRKFSTCKF